jgi:hypothetical protein
MIFGVAAKRTWAVFTITILKGKRRNRKTRAWKCGWVLRNVDGAQDNRMVINV